MSRSSPPRLPATLSKLLNPASVAIVGASRSPDKYGHIVPRCLLEDGYAGDVYLVNPRAGEAFGRPFHPSLADIDAPIDLVVSLLPPERTLAVIEDCVRAKVGGVVLLAAGFAETGEEGAGAQRAVSELARESGVRLLGPNCLGLFNASAHLNVMAKSRIPVGPIALITQSGGLAEMFFHEARRLGGGLSLCVSVGNQADIGLAEAIDYAAEDPGSRAIALYVEGAADGRALIASIRRAVENKPVVALKGGRDAAGARATISHTASLAGSAGLYDALLDSAGAIVIRDLADFYPVALAVSHCPPLGGRRIALVGGGGGQGTLMADAMERHALEIPLLPSALQKTIRALTSARSSISNPIEFAGANERSFAVYEQTIEAVLRSDAIDGVCVFGSFGGFRPELENEAGNYVRSARAFGALTRKLGKPIIVQTYYAGGTHPAFAALREEAVPCFASPETSARSMRALAEASRLPGGRVATRRPPTPQAAHHSTRLLDPTAAAALLARPFAPVVPIAEVIDTAQALVAARRIGFPVVLKLVQPRVAHKTEVGGVATNLCSEPELEAAVTRMLELAAARLDGPIVLGISPMIRDGVEAVVGAVRDAAFGPVVMVGSGGIHLELHGDVAFAMAGLDLAQARTLLESTQLHSILEGYRGQTPLDEHSLAQLVVALSRLMLERPDIVEIDLNPVLVQESGVWIADARVAVSD